MTLVHLQRLVMSGVANMKANVAWWICNIIINNENDGYRSRLSGSMVVSRIYNFRTKR